MADTNVRPNREAESRDNTQRVKSWVPPQTLPTPQPQNGYGFRWIRTALLGQADPTNMSAKLREGWEPVKASEHPELLLMSDPTSRFKDNIEVGGLLLCKAPMELVKQRDAWYAKQADSQIESVDNNLMKLNDARMPLFNDRKSEVRFGKGSK